MNGRIYGPLLINLDKRTDRLKKAKDEFEKLDLNYIRISATSQIKPVLGCMDSHCRCLEEFLKTDKYDAVMICEDDVKFNTDKTTLHKHIDEFMKGDGHVLCLGYYISRPTNWSELLHRSNDIQSRVCYIVKKEVAADLLDIWRKLYIYLIQNPIPPLKNWYSSLYNNLPIINKARDIYRGDQAWKILQQKYYFLIPKFHLVVQRPSYSDIEMCYVDYKV